jgi:hypothetical protein
VTIIAYKLFRVRRDGSIGSLFIAPSRRLPLHKWLPAECLPTKGFKVRPGWHACPLPYAPHLSTRGRRWFVVLLEDVTVEHRPQAQGGKWFLALWCRILRPVEVGKAVKFTTNGERPYDVKP